MNGCARASTYAYENLMPGSYQKNNIKGKGEEQNEL